MDSQRPDSLEERYLDVQEAAQLLEVDQRALMDLVDRREVPSHHLAGALLRFKKHDLEQLKIRWRIERGLFPAKGVHAVPPSGSIEPAGLLDRLKDFWYFNDFYIICSLVAAALVAVIIIS